MVLGATLAIQVLAISPEPLVGLALLIGGGVSVEFANGISGLLYVLTIPVSTIALTLLYRQLKEEAGSSARLEAEV